MKKTLALLLTLFVVLTVSTVTVFAAETDVAKIGDVGYATIEAAFAAANDGETITLLADAAPVLTSQRAITKASVIDLNGNTLTLTEDDLYFGTIAFKNGNIVVDPSVKPSTAVFWMFANQTLTFDGVKLTATGVTGTYLIGLDGNNSDLNLLNGSEIIIDNTTALDLDVICVNASTGNDIVIEDSKVSVNNLDGRVFFRGNYTVSGASDIDLSGITKAGFRIEAGQTLTIEDTATVDITGEPRDGGIHLVASTSKYTKAETATVNATVEKPAPAGNNFTGYTRADAIWGEVWGNATESFVIKVLDANDNVMGTTSLNNIGGILNGNVNVTWSIKLDAPSNTDGYWTMEWTTAPSLDNMPAKVELWVDGVNVSGGNVVLNGPDNIHEIYAATTDADGKILSYEKSFEDAITAGDNVAILRAGTYKVPSGKNITITGAVDGVVFDNIGAHNMGSASVTFNNVTFNYAANSTYAGLQHSGNLVYNNCIFNGQVFLYGLSETFNTCTFNNIGDNYNVWTYGAKEVVFNGCTFNSDGKSVLVYNEGATHFINLTVVDSDFNASAPVDGKAAIEIDTSLTAGAKISVDAATTATGFGTGNKSGNSLWNNKKGNDTEANNDVTVAVAGETVLKPVVLSLSGTGTAEDPFLINNLEELIWFRDHVDSCEQDGSSQYAGKYIKLTADIDLEGINWDPIGEKADHGTFNGTFDGDGHTISNLYINADGDYLGFFSRTSGGGDGPQAVIKNLNFCNVDVSSNTTTGHGGSYVGGVIANSGGNTVISNVHVTGDVYVVGYGYVGGIVGHGYPDIDNCSVDADDGSYIHGYYWCVGGIIGYAGEGGTPITNSSVSGVDIWSAYGGAAAVAGMLQDGNKLENVSASNVEITSNSDYCMGYIAGNGNGSTLTGVTMTNVTATVNGAAISATDAVATIGNKIYSNLAEAIAAVDANDVVIELLADVTLDYNAREAYGTAATTSLTIKGNGHTLTLNQKDSDWSSIGLTNANAKLVLNDMTIEKTGYGDTSGAWNTHAIIFTCNVEMNNVTVNNAIVVEDGATLNNVTINEANGYYGLWISGNGQTVTMNGGSITATNGGRGIKIADQYVDAVESVTLNVTGTTFTTAKKAAILVTSTEGAAITVSNIDISGVAQDKIHAVWMDEDRGEHFDKVTVVGGNVLQEGEFACIVIKNDAILGYYKTLEAAFADASDDDTVVLLDNVNVAVTYAVNKTLTLDLNGYEIESDADVVLTASAGELTIVDNSADKTGAIVSDGKTAIHSSAYVAIQSGKFDGAITTANGQIDDSQVCITGGTFTQNPDADLVEHSYTVLTNEDGTYTVVDTEYTLTIINAGANASGAGIYIYGDIVTVYAGEMNGYFFGEWGSEDVDVTGFTSDTVTFVMPDHDVTLTVYWSTHGPANPSTPVVLPGTLNFETNGGTPIDSISRVAGTKVDLSQFVTVREGYTFTGWYSDAALTKPVTAITVRSTKTVYAGWIQNAVTPDIPVVVMPFTDVAADAYYYNAVLWAVNTGITTGMTDTMFGPDLVCTRAQVVTFLWRAAGCPVATNNDMPFADVSRDMYYYDAVLWAVEMGITNGISDTEFAPDAECSRAQIVTFLWRALGAPDAAADAGFVDVDADAYYATAVEWAVDNGITNGMGDNTFDADADCTRGQTVTFLFRFFCK